MIEKIHEQNKKELENLESKMNALLKLQRRERSNIEQVAEQRCQNSMALQEEHKEYSRKMEKEKERLEKQVTEYGNLLNLIKEEFK